jgi:hypothetical protein
LGWYAAVEKTIRVLENVKYIILPDADIRDYVIAIAQDEWEPADFDLFGQDLYQSQWVLAEVEIAKIAMRTELLTSEAFLEDVTPRIETQLKIIPEGVAVPPLILRGSDFLIFDGYARTNALRRLGKSRCLAYVGRQR